MKVGSAFHSGLQGVQRNLDRLDQAADNIAKAGTTRKQVGASDVAEELVNVNTSVLHTKASLRVLEAGNELIGNFFDSFA